MKYLYTFLSSKIILQSFLGFFSLSILLWSGQNLMLKISTLKVISSQIINPQYWKVIPFSYSSNTILHAECWLLFWFHNATYWILSLVSLKVRLFMSDLVIDPSAIKRMFLSICILVKLRLTNIPCLWPSFFLSEEPSPCFIEEVERTIKVIILTSAIQFWVLILTSLTFKSFLDILKIFWT